MCVRMWCVRMWCVYMCASACECIHMCLNMYVHKCKRLKEKKYTIWRKHHGEEGKGEIDET